MARVARLESVVLGTPAGTKVLGSGGTGLARLSVHYGTVLPGTFVGLSSFVQPTGTTWYRKPQVPEFINNRSSAMTQELWQLSPKKLGPPNFCVKTLKPRKTKAFPFNLL